MPVYYAVYKPFGVLSQFTAPPGKKSLKDFFQVEKDVYPVGRLDEDSEGLLILTNDKFLNHALLDPKNAHERSYWVQVEGCPEPEKLEILEKGVVLSGPVKKFKTRPCEASLLEETPPVADRNPPIRFRKNIPTSWISLVLREGKNRQVRKMTAAIGYPTLRLIRFQIGKLSIGNMRPGEIRSLSRKDCYQSLLAR